MTWRRFLGRFLRYALLAVIILLLAGELLIRRMVPDELTYTPPIKNWDLRKHTNLLGDLLKGEMIPVGDRPVTKGKPDWMTRVVCLGGAITAGAGLENRNEAYPALLQQARDRLDVLDAGCPGYDAYRLQVYLTEVLVHLSPDVVVLHYGGAVESGTAARRFHEQAAQVVARLQARGKDNPDDLLFAVNHGTANRFFLLGHRLLDRSRAYLFFHDRAVTRRRILEDNPTGCETLESLSAMAELLAGQGVKLILIPETTTAGEPVCPPNAAWMAEQCHTGRAVCLERFAGMAPAEAAKYYADRTHLNRAGHERLARELSATIAGLPSTATPGDSPANSSE